MPSMLKKAMLFLGLGSDEDFEAFDHESRSPHDPRTAPDTGTDAERVRPIAPDTGEGRVQPMVRSGMTAPEPSPRPAVAPRPERREIRSAVRPLPAEEVPEELKQTSVVRPVPAPRSVKPAIVSPVSFNDAQEVADHFKRKQPVIVNLQQADDDLKRRLIDFASGLCYGVGGAMKKAADSVYLLTPADVEVSAEERARLQEAGLLDR